MLTEYVRIALRRHLCRRFSHNKTWISVLRLGDGVEHLIRDSIRQTSSGTYSALEERQSLLILNKIKTHLLKTRMRYCLPPSMFVALSAKLLSGISSCYRYFPGRNWAMK